ncbi:MAG: DUF362 domain-containing protein [Candidatus Poribacteria bacterium]|nr:DUF362 domain-containing protein [Candidatus Poribacteria bacterium]
MSKNYKVRASYCNHRVSEEEIYQTLKRTTDPLTKSWQQIEKARQVVIKFNMMKLPERIEYFQGRRRELVDDAFCRATLRLIKEHTTAQLIATDTNPYNNGNIMPTGFNYEHHLKEFDVQFVDSSLPPFGDYEVPNGGLMFNRYTLSRCFEEADAMVSVAKMKNHAFMGITLCTKNLFGLPPIIPPEGRTRSYYHHLVRLSYVLPDLALITKPCLNIIDALTGQSGREWGGEGRICDAMIAGDHPIATDACGMYLMGTDPKSDWPTPPFKRDRNHVLIAAQHGFGTVDLEQIDFESEVEPPLADFDSVETDSLETVRNWRLTTCQQGIAYLENQRQLVDKYRGQFIYMQGGEVVWNGLDPSDLGSRRQLSGTKKDSALWLKLVDPDEHEGEKFSVYERLLSDFAA